MKKLSCIFVSFVALLLALQATAQTADEIISKHVEAIGGKEKISQIKSLFTEGTVEVMGNTNPSTTTVLNGKGFRTESEFNGSKFVQVFTEKGGWSINPMAGGSPEAIPDDQFKAGKSQIYIGGPLFDYAGKGNTVELLGKENNAYKIKVTSTDKIESFYFIDAGSYYITKATRKGNMRGEDVEITFTFSNYQKTDFGYVIPFKIDTDFGGNFSLSVTVKKAEVNKEVDPSIFEMPK
jgi:outer membrane lipoprotein-sorting protein